MIRMEQIYYLQQIAKYGSINKAAETLFLTGSAVSASIKQMEMECGYKILERTYRGVKLTKNGKLALEIADKILVLEDELRTLGGTKSREKHKLFIEKNLFKMFSKKIIGVNSKVLDDFEIVEIESKDDYQSILQQSDYAMITVISSKDKEKYDEDDRLCVNYLCSSKRYPISSKTTKHIKPFVKSLSLEELKRLPKIKLKSDNLPLNHNIIFETDDTSVFESAILNDYGIGLVSRFANDIFCIDCDQFKVYEPLDGIENFLAIISGKQCDTAVIELLKKRLI